MEQYGIDTTPTQSFIDKKTGTLVYVSVDGVYAGCIIISDIIKPTSAKAVKDLKKAGVKKVVMLTGDSKKVADAVGKQIGVDVVKSELLPADKVFEVEKLLDEKEKNEVLAHCWRWNQWMLRYCNQSGHRKSQWEAWVPMRRSKQRILS